jgi:hypothetical protein
MGEAYRSLHVIAGLDPAIPAGTGRDNGATDRGYGSWGWPGDPRVKPGTGHDDEGCPVGPK